MRSAEVGPDPGPRGAGSRPVGRRRRDRRDRRRHRRRPPRPGDARLRPDRGAVRRRRHPAEHRHRRPGPPRPRRPAAVRRRPVRHRHDRRRCPRGLRRRGQSGRSGLGQAPGDGGPDRRGDGLADLLVLDPRRRGRSASRSTSPTPRAGFGPASMPMRPIVAEEHAGRADRPGHGDRRGGRQAALRRRRRRQGGAPAGRAGPERRHAAPRSSRAWPRATPWSRPMPPRSPTASRPGRRARRPSAERLAMRSAGSGDGAPSYRIRLVRRPPVGAGSVRRSSPNRSAP